MTFPVPEDVQPGGCHPALVDIADGVRRLPPTTHHWRVPIFRRPLAASVGTIDYEPLSCTELLLERRRYLAPLVHTVLPQGVEWDVWVDQLGRCIAADVTRDSPPRPRCDRHTTIRPWPPSQTRVVLGCWGAPGHAGTTTDTHYDPIHGSWWGGEMGCGYVEGVWAEWEPAP